MGCIVMVMIKIGKSPQNIAFLLILAVSIVAGFFFLYRHFHTPVSAQFSGCIEIFDIGRGEVVRQVEPDRKTRREAETLLKNITGFYLKFKPLPDKGRIVRIPFEPVYKLKNKWLNDCGITEVDTLYVLFPEEGAPYLLVLDGKKRPFFFNIKGDTYFHTLCNVGV